MVWRGTSFEGRTELVPLNYGRINADRYITNILDPHVVPYMPHIGDNSVLMHDNARPQAARVVRQYLEEVEIPTLNWPARSPDLNPIKHVWGHLEWQI